MESVLSDEGLTPIEIKVYLALVDGGMCSAGELSRRAGVHRRLAYDATERLVAKGLVGHITKNNRKNFEAVRPDRLLEMVDERKKRLSEAVLTLQGRWNLTEAKQETLLFEGKQGLKTAFEDQLRTGKEILIVSSSAKSYETMRWYFKWFDERRKKAKVNVKVIFEESAKKTLGKIPLSQVRFLPEQFMGPAAINVYGDNVALVLWSEKPIAIVIRNKEMARGYQNFFELLWKTAKE
jgi:sugar-specific transcriptional regulator TrmB